MAPALQKILPATHPPRLRIPLPDRPPGAFFLAMPSGLAIPRNLTTDSTLKVTTQSTVK